jgi:hypothetical protein
MFYTEYTKHKSLYELSSSFITQQTHNNNREIKSYTVSILTTSLNNKKTTKHCEDILLIGHTKAQSPNGM